MTNTVKVPEDPPPAYSHSDDRSVETNQDTDTTNLIRGGATTGNVGAYPAHQRKYVTIERSFAHLVPKAGRHGIWAAAFDANNWIILAFFLLVDLPWAIFCTTWVLTTAGLAIGFMVLPFLGIPMGIVFAYSWILLAKADMAMLKQIYPEEEAHVSFVYPPIPQLTVQEGEFFPSAVLRIFRETFLSPDAWKAAIWLGFVKIILAPISFTLACLALCLFVPAMVCCLAGPVFAVMRLCGWLEYFGAWTAMGRPPIVVANLPIAGAV
ncbi:hypothetical protein M427DRAFT_68893 [Gonapodya prolifera JEL478]|uniref:Sensor domain-containing protein n=1 Tax=Gonapodya prolifera (strain JEL478) TaxID=1344416 RepID=A0A139AJK0_GONPJ|nr:hypothetical protein M427DRAFT_68893 [Gonapodya prolifera JEL478]|eukprot:KXS16888.1 hypothetical protein M427DRAFT_68893 [Gonapodya prolifera JEL478]